MSDASEGNNEAAMTETLALAICLQLAGDYEELMQKAAPTGLREVKLTPLTCKTQSHISDRIGAYLPSKSQRQARQLHGSIVRKYNHYLNFLNSRKYHGEESKSVV